MPFSGHKVNTLEQIMGKISYGNQICFFLPCQLSGVGLVVIKFVWREVVIMVRLNIVLLEPEIPQNTGNIGRTCSAIGADLHLIYI